MGYTKLFSIADSSLIEEEIATRYIFMFMLSIADFSGCFDGSLLSLARRANVSVEDMEKALDTFQSPDLKSKSKDEDGRRVIYQGANKWWLVNYVNYRTERGDDRSYQKMQWRKRAAKKLALEKGEEWNENGWYRQDALKQGASRELTGLHDYTDADADTVVIESNSSKGNNRYKPPTERECAEWLDGKLLTEYAVAEAEKFVDFYESKNWMVGKTKMSKWRSSLGGWAARAVADGRAKYTKEEKERKIKARLAKIGQLKRKDNEK